MKDYLRQITEGSSALEAKNRIREYLQARVLGALQRSGAMVPWAFHGGTALRFLYRIPRYSEDLDFALERPEKDARGLKEHVQAVRRELVSEGYKVELKASDRRVVHSAFVRFPELLWELGLAPQRAAVLSVKLEVDTRPPKGAALATTVVRLHETLHLQHHDQSSLLAGKVHAVLARPYLKGRDLFDLVWYLADPTWPPPNLELLNHALEQTGHAQKKLTLSNWRSVVARRLLREPIAKAVQDVLPFLERAQDAMLLDRAHVRTLLKQK